MADHTFSSRAAANIRLIRTHLQACSSSLISLESLVALGSPNPGVDSGIRHVDSVQRYVKALDLEFTASLKNSPPQRQALALKLAARVDAVRDFLVINNGSVRALSMLDELRTRYLGRGGQVSESLRVVRL